MGKLQIKEALNYLFIQVNRYLFYWMQQMCLSLVTTYITEFSFAFPRWISEVSQERSIECFLVMLEKLHD